MKPYADTSLLFSIYVKDSHSPKAESWPANFHYPLPLTDFHRIELKNAFCLANYQKRVDPNKVESALKILEQDLFDGVLMAEAIEWNKVFAEAERLVQIHTSSLGTRTLDIIHIASAKILGATDFFTADLRQAKLASEEHLNVTIP